MPRKKEKEEEKEIFLPYHLSTKVTSIKFLNYVITFFITLLYMPLVIVTYLIYFFIRIF